ncbi:hypothetical protein KIM372_13620 [Bombiscardovia nodaiensis]|uniref:Uncharacterized protein n=1 Tax=Bombiscardovia nodaiensis TaxID=2932181 RepID=A0ABM8B989_9BIFI|nr:hypothetical protein KIM372_13620 [Bombiscardovia nodaiensis]
MLSMPLPESQRKVVSASLWVSGSFTLLLPRVAIAWAKAGSGRQDLIGVEPSVQGGLTAMPRGLIWGSLTPLPVSWLLLLRLTG